MKPVGDASGQLLCSFVRKGNDEQTFRRLGLKIIGGVATSDDYPFLLAAKTFITKPRFDPTELPPERAKRRQLSMFVVLGIALFAGLLTFLLIAADVGWARPWLDQYLLPTAVLVIAIGLVGLLHGYTAPLSLCCLLMLPASGSPYRFRSIQLPVVSA